ncbi:MAG: lysine--tRNA ligase [delta proteobacterium ML8_F1]|nr:MAG: lysine--tRNA ligase [delta proteobacterium ML8_F1]
MTEELNLNEVLKIRREKLKQLRAMGRDPFLVEKYERTSFSAEILEHFEKFESKEVSVAGRIMAKRTMGKAAFIDVLDSEGRIQVYVRGDEIGEEEYEIFSSYYDIGDIVGVKGKVFMTRKEEISIRATEVVLLSKSLQVLPEKFHGLKDQDLRYRQRYVDLIVNPEVKKTFLLRNRIISAMREFLEREGFLEVDTPILGTVAGGAAARPFVTHHNTLDIDMYMRIANELYLKRLIVGGFDKVYEMGKMFRNEGMSVKHNPEYTAMELYAAYKDYEYIMWLTENVVAHMAQKATGSTIVNYQGIDLDFTPPWRRITMVDAILQYTGINFNELRALDQATKAAQKLGIEVSKDMEWGHIVAEVFETFCEKHLVQPTFVTHHPVAISPLSKRNPDDPEVTNRFEAFANTWEIANAFSELNDPIDQRERFTEQAKRRDDGIDEEAHPMDEDFLNALEVGLPPTGGLGIGIDRVIMLLTNVTSIRDIILFPTMKPIE